MKSRRRFESIFVALLFVALSTAVVWAQDGQGGYPTPSAQPQAYPDQSGQPTYPSQPQQYPDQQQYPSQPQQYPDQQQQYPSQQQQQYPSQPQGAPDQNNQAYNGQQQQDPPGRVARIQYMSGQVSTQPGGVNDWIAAQQNRPLTSSDRVWTDKDSKAELNVGDGFLRMNSETSVTLANVTDQNVQIELDQGTLEVTVKHLEKGEVYEIDTPNYAFTVMKSGVYRFDVYPNQDQSVVTVRSGYGEATGKGAAVRVNSGQQIRFSGGTSLVHTASEAPPRDGFDDWAQVRDKRLDSSLSAQYVSPGVIGYQDLDGYGRWTQTPQYGNVWVPYSVPTGWAPYRFGHWAWIAPWGWTWVDDQPWGFAPFHYGRWVSYGGYWGWAPGPVGYWNPYYAPALVGWIGGPGFGIGFGFGGGGWGIGINFGWFPLGWGEPFYPRYCGWGYGGWYRGGGFVSNNYIRNVNITNTHITNITNVTNNYYNGNAANARYGFRNTAGAVTAAPKSAFTSGAAINRAGGAVPASALGKGNVLSGVNATPTRQSVIGGAAQAHNTPPASAFNRNVVTANRGGASSFNKPANLETANQATAQHGNMNAFGGADTNHTANVGGAANNNMSRPNFGGNTAAENRNMGTPAQNTHMNTPAGSQTANTMHAPENGTANTARGNSNVAEARNDVPTSMGGHYVPRPPSAGGNPVAHPTTNGSAAGANTNGHTNTNGTQSANNSHTTASQPYGGGNTNAAHPNQATQPGHSSTPQSSTPHSASPSNSAPKGGNSSGSHESSGNGGHGSAALSAPRPPANYSYHAAPTYSASSSYGSASRPYGSSYGNTSYGANRSYSASPSYSGSRPYSGASSNTAQRSYGSSSAYPNRSYGSATPSYSARSYGGGSMPSSSRSGGSSYSAPHYSSGSTSHSGGGSTSHSSGGGGGHSGGGGGHR
jgi:ferric-dicitrate binding protein FerR (iron transport regulator)